MKTFGMTAAVLAMALSFGSRASAGVYADDLSRCLVSSSTRADKVELIQWIFGLIALNGEVKSMVKVTEAQRETYNRNMARLLERLLTQDCRKASIDAIKYEGASTLESSFGVLGEAAMRELMSDPAVTEAAGVFAGYIDDAKLEAMSREAVAGGAAK